MPTKDVRWIQRFQNLQKAFAKFSEAIQIANTRGLSELERQGLIQAFEFTHELAWNVLKDYLENQGIQDIRGPRDAVRAAFKAGLLEDGESWMEMIESRNKTRHTYNEAVSSEIERKILSAYYDALDVMINRFEALAKSVEQ